MNALKVAQPRDLREALGLAFVHRARVRWQAGPGGFLGLEYAGEPDAEAAMLLDIRRIPEFHEIRADGAGVTIGAFAAADAAAREPRVARSLGAGPFAPETVRFRLAALGANLVIAGPGATRRAPLAGALAPAALPPQEIPLAVELGAAMPGVAFGDRRLRRRDGAASFDLRVFTALALAGFHRIRSATVAYSIDGAATVPIVPVGLLLDGAMIARATFHEAARRAADAFNGDDERTNVLRRSIIPLVLSALNDAYGHARRAHT